MKRCFLIPKIDFELGWLKEYLQPGDRIIPLGIDPFTSLRNFWPEIDSVEAWVPFQKIQGLAVRAYELNQAFAAQACQGELWEGYDCPRICANNQDYFFRDLLLAEELALSLNRARFEKVFWLGNPDSTPSLVLPTMNGLARTFAFYLGNTFSTLKPPRSSLAQTWTRCGEKFLNGLGLVKKQFLLAQKGKVRKCHGVAIFPSSGEWPRFSEPLRELHQEYGGDFQVWSLGQITEGLKVWAEAEKISVTWVPYPDRAGREATVFFQKHWESWQRERGRGFAQKMDCPVLASDLLQFHFRYHFTSIWPRMAEYARVLERYLMEAQPRWLVGSSSPSSAQLFPYYVAAKVGIRSIALPHGYVQMGDSRIGSSLLACRNLFERIHFTHSFPDDRQILMCRNAADELSYCAKPLKDFSYGPQKLVIILTGGPDFPETIMSMADRNKFLQAFSQLAEVPEDLTDLHFLIKAHPRLPLSSIFQTLGIQSSQMTVVDPQSSLVDLLNQAWAVIMFNHFGSAVVHAIRAGKPILFLNSAQLFWPLTEWLSFPSGEVVEDIPSLWNLLRRLKTSPLYYQELLEKCQTFKSEYLQPAEGSLGQHMRMWETQRTHQPPDVIIQPMPSF